MFSLIACIGKNREIGKSGKLVFNIKNDMQFFRKTTLDHTVVMGYNTWKSLPSKLRNRKNLVVSEKPVENADGTISDLDVYIAKNKDTDEEIFIIGGGTIYKQFLPHAKNLYLTEVDSSDPDADTFFPEFNQSKYSKELIKKGKENDLTFSIIKYIKN